ncbi:LPD3 domain-containing protein [Helicobacter sp. T3_23-1056]
MTKKQIAFYLSIQIVKSYARFCAKKIFDSSNPNIYHANATLGGGVLGGSIAGLEYDENGDIKGFNPQNFALGFASGALASKGLQTSAKRLEKLANRNPKAKALLERIKTKHTKNQSNLATMSNQKLAKGNQMAESITIITQSTQNIRELRSELNTALASIKDTELINKATGLKASISQHEINKISNPKAVNKSVVNGFSRDEHFKTAENLKELYENAYLKNKHLDDKGRGWEVYRLVAELKINKKLAQAKITAFEKKIGKNRIYTIELEELNSIP